MHAKETTNTADSVDPIAGNHNVGVNNNNINNNGDPSLGQENPQHGSLFVGDLSIFCTEADMQEAFQPHGEIVEVKVMRCDETHKNLCYGFVKFSNQEDAQRAMDALNSSLLCGRPMRISWASHKARGKLGGQDDIAAAENQFMNTSSVHVSYSANQVHTRITEETLRGVFGKFGKIHDITIKKFEVDAKLGIQRGYGFVHFPASENGVNAALKCAEDLKDQVVDGIHYKCDISHKLLRQLRSSHSSSSEKLGRSRHNSSFSGRSTSTSRDFSQSSDVNDIVLPTIELSAMSMESVGSAPSMYAQVPMPYYQAGGLMYPSPVPPHPASSTPAALYPEPIFVDSFQQMAYAMPPGPPGYVYYPSPVMTPTSAYTRTLNPSGGKAPYSSSTTTMLGEKKNSYSSSSFSSATTPTAASHSHSGSVSHSQSSDPKMHRNVPAVAVEASRSPPTSGKDPSPLSPPTRAQTQPVPVQQGGYNAPQSAVHAAPPSQNPWFSAGPHQPQQHNAPPQYQSYGGQVYQVSTPPQAHSPLTNSPQPLLPPPIHVSPTQHNYLSSGSNQGPQYQQQQQQAPPQSQAQQPQQQQSHHQQQAPQQQVQQQQATHHQHQLPQQQQQQQQQHSHAQPTHQLQHQQTAHHQLQHQHHAHHHHQQQQQQQHATSPPPPVTISSTAKTAPSQSAYNGHASVDVAHAQPPVAHLQPSPVPSHFAMPPAAAAGMSPPPSSMMLPVNVNMSGVPTVPPPVMHMPMVSMMPGHVVYHQGQYPQGQQPMYHSTQHANQAYPMQPQQPGVTMAYSAYGTPTQPQLAQQVQPAAQYHGYAHHHPHQQQQPAQSQQATHGYTQQPRSH